ncbi:hypothetical protein C7S18_09700 [Ahniella affigens]|uniref:DUF11 domain-containing protein n=1 Tax=Ahniella affigens TaxID=2021234 RepID=A0A2P1PRJ3_9GAMM|nr:DUF11 domain-containing protein [Ahniella affigens]AVP97454.1 hypothetical protein C7S18_09700 [Ahniella affigens]
MACRLFCVLMLAMTLVTQAFAQSADQEVVSVVDSPDPVIPGQNITYTITLRNNGPNPAVNGGLNVNLSNNLTHLSNTPPPGFTCFVAGANMTCNTPSFAVGTVQIVIVARLEPALVNFPDGSVTSVFFPSGTTVDPVPGNNQQSSITQWDSPQIDLSIAVTDTPDPVGPDQNIVYSITVNQAGPNNAQNVNMNTFNNGSLRFQSINPAPGFSCTPLAVGATPTLTCNAATVPPGTYAFTLTVLADDAILGPSDGSVAIAFSAGGTGNDTNQANNQETEDTIYRTPDADLSIAVDDLPDPAQLGSDFTYLVTMHNHGPDAATNATINSFNNGSLRYQSIETPMGSTCTLPAVGAAPTISCRVSSLASGSDMAVIVTVRTDEALLGPNGGTVSTVFSAGSAIQDPDGLDNSETENTVVQSSLLFRNGFE